MKKQQARIKVRRVEGSPVVALRALLPAGQRCETIPGQALIAGRMLAEGTRTRDWRKIAAAAESRGAAITTSAGSDAQVVAIDALADDWEAALRWTAELLYEPSFPEERCAWLRRQAAAELRSLQDQPEVRTGRSHLHGLYPEHPLGRPPQGSAAGLAELSVTDCSAFHRRALSGGPRIAVAGLVDEEQVLRRAETIFSELSKERGESKLTSPPLRFVGGERQVGLDQREQAHLFVGRPTVRRSHPDWAALLLLGVAVGAGPGLNGRIPQRVREEKGLAYACHVETVAAAGLDPGRLTIYAAVSPQHIKETLCMINEELRSVCADGISTDELEAARSYLMRREPFRRETARQWAELMAESLLLNLPVDDPMEYLWALESASKAQLAEVAARWFSPEQMLITVGMPGG